VKLIIFDLDGTLTRTNAVDEWCFPQAFAKSFRGGELSTDWAAYTHATDTVVFQEAFAQSFGRMPNIDEAQKIEQCFVELLNELYASNVAMFVETAGASALLNHLKQDSRWAIAIATGCWKRSADFKIAAAEIPAADLPMASAEDGPSRETIIEAAAARAAAYYQERKFERIISVGDGVWDAKAAQKLKLPFVGIAEGVRMETLRQAGASHVVEDFLDPLYCLECFEAAKVPMTR
jgi:phosphoglycolate phosphatase-like HAD superfamily hydrolase